MSHTYPIQGKIVVKKFLEKVSRGDFIIRNQIGGPPAPGYPQNPPGYPQNPPGYPQNPPQGAEPIQYYELQFCIT